MNALIEKLKSATGPMRSREVTDLAYETGFEGANYALLVAALRGEIDPIGPALALVERMLPEYDWEVGRYDGETYHAMIWQSGRKIETSQGAHGSTPALAILIALFTALAAKDAQE